MPLHRVPSMSDQTPNLEGRTQCSWRIARRKAHSHDRFFACIPIFHCEWLITIITWILALLEHCRWNLDDIAIDVCSSSSIRVKWFRPFELKLESAIFPQRSISYTYVTTLSYADSSDPVIPRSTHTRMYSFFRRYRSVDPSTSY